MNFQVLLHPKAADFLNKCDDRLRTRIKNKLRKLKDNPKAQGKRLKHSNFRKLRIGSHRAIYTVEKEDRKVIILFIGHRRNVYDDFSRIF